MTIRNWAAAFLLAFPACAFSQKFSHGDSLRGDVNGGARYWWDVTSYELSVDFNETTKEISGSNRIAFRPGSNLSGSEKARRYEGLLQIDLQAPLVLDSVVFNFAAGNRKLDADSVIRDGNAYFIVPPKKSTAFTAADENAFTVYYHGKPRAAVAPPWDGGVIWRKDSRGNPWISVACQGLGASAWYPCKDSQADEPESATMHFSCREDLTCVSNGRFLGKQKTGNGRAVYTWHVSSPINNYCIIPYIGDYVNLHEHYSGEKGMLELDYWVLRGNEEKARMQFREVPRTMEALEYWFGPYPFYEDGYKLIEAPHLGMEHQSAVAYGNGFSNGYMGKDLSGTGIGLKWDYIIVHETGHEWFGNNITTADIADMWVHEGFTDYSETLFTGYWFGEEDAAVYLRGLRKLILNDKPITGSYGVNSEGSGDMYFKGANMLHTLRKLTGDDSLFRGMLRGLNATFYHKIVTARQVEEYMSAYLKTDLGKFFDQYLRQRYPPTLGLKYGRKKLKYRWVNVVKGFDMPVVFEGSPVKMEASEKWHSVPYAERTDPSGNRSFVYPVVDKNLYIKTTGSIPEK